MSDAETHGREPGAADPELDRPARGLAERTYDLIENGAGQGTIAMIAFLVALPIVVVVAHCVMF